MKIIDAEYIIGCIDIAIASSECDAGTAECMEMFKKVIEAAPEIHCDNCPHERKDVKAVSEKSKCVFCKGRAFTKKPVTIRTLNGRVQEAVIRFCPECGRELHQAEKQIVHKSGCYICKQAKWDADGCTCDEAGLHIANPSGMLCVQEGSDQ